MADRGDFDQADLSRSRKVAASVRYDPTRDRESKRGWIALTLVFLFVAMVCVLVIAMIARLLDSEGLEKIAVVLLNPVTVLVGTVVGFYFGEQRRGHDGF